MALFCLDHGDACSQHAFLGAALRLAERSTGISKYMVLLPESKRLPLVCLRVALIVRVHGPTPSTRTQFTQTVVCTMESRRGESLGAPGLCTGESVAHQELPLVPQRISMCGSPPLFHRTDQSYIRFSFLPITTFLFNLSISTSLIYNGQARPHHDRGKPNQPRWWQWLASQPSNDHGSEPRAIRTPVLPAQCTISW